MLTKNEFVKAINDIKHINDRLDKDVKTYELLLAFCKYSLQDSMISLLESAMAIPVDKNYGSIISWWIYEDDYGKNEWDIRSVDNNGQLTNEKINTPEELYEYCKNISAED